MSGGFLQIPRFLCLAWRRILSKSSSDWNVRVYREMLSRHCKLRMRLPIKLANDPESTFCNVSKRAICLQISTMTTLTDDPQRSFYGNVVKVKREEKEFIWISIWSKENAQGRARFTIVYVYTLEAVASFRFHFLSRSLFKMYKTLHVDEFCAGDKDAGFKGDIAYCQFCGSGFSYDKKGREA